MDIATFSGPDVRAHLDAVAALRIRVFRDWPYLYDGDPAYEQKYLAAYAQSPQSLFVLAFDGERIVGASTAVPLADETQAFQQAFLARGIPLADVFYFGESVLLPEYRGRGIGHAFFDAREGYARRLGRFALAAFCAVVRAADDPRRPAGHRGNEAFWTKRGYVPQDDMTCTLEWKEIGAAEPVQNRLRYWLRPLERGT